MTPAIELRSVCKSYGTFEAVRDVSLRVMPGEVFGLLGPNGAGKTTLMRIAIAIIREDSGEVRILGQRLDRPLRDRLGYLPEERGIYQRSAAVDVVAYAARLKGLGKRLAVARSLEALERVGLGREARSPVSSLSKGLQQKVQLAATIVHAPAVLILDEPMTGLDPINRDLVAGLIRAEAARGAAIVFSSHDMASVERLCDRALLIHRGTAILDGLVPEIKRRFARNEIIIAAGGKPRERIVLPEGQTPEAYLASVVARGLAVEHFERALPSLEEVFIRVVGEKVELGPS